MTIQPVPQLDELAHAEAMFASVQVTLAELREALECLKKTSQSRRGNRCNTNVQDIHPANGCGRALSKSGNDLE